MVAVFYIARVTPAPAPLGLNAHAAARRFGDRNIRNSRMIEFLRTAGAIDRIERMIDDARQRVVLITPFVQLNPQIAERLQEAGERGVAVTFVYSKISEETSPRPSMRPSKPSRGSACTTMKRSRPRATSANASWC